MKKLFLSLFLIFTFSAYAISQHSFEEVTPATLLKENEGLNNLFSSRKENPTSGPEQTDENTITSAPNKNQKSIPMSRPSSMPAQGSPMMARYKNGSYTGDIVPQYYGDIQVQAVISGGRLIDVVFLRYPNRSTSHQVNIAYALPLLKQEAIASQSANIDAISGASETSPAFIASLDSALRQALI